MVLAAWGASGGAASAPLRVPAVLADDFSFYALPDWVIGILVLILFLIVVFAVGWVLSKIKNAKFARDWAPLIPVIGGEVVSDGGPANRSWLTGKYRGKRIHAEMIPNRNRYTGTTGHYYNSFEIELLEVPSGQDWTIDLYADDFGFGETKPRIRARDAALAERLEHAGALDLAGRLGWPTIRYNARQQTLHSSGDVTPRLTSTPERFREELDLLLELAQLNERVNP